MGYLYFTRPNARLFCDCPGCDSAGGTAGQASDGGGRRRRSADDGEAETEAGGGASEQRRRAEENADCARRSAGRHVHDAAVQWLYLGRRRLQRSLVRRRRTRPASSTGNTRPTQPEAGNRYQPIIILYYANRQQHSNIQ